MDDNHLAFLVMEIFFLISCLSYVDLTLLMVGEFFQINEIVIISISDISRIQMKLFSISLSLNNFSIEARNSSVLVN